MKSILQQALDFSDEDLQANREGKLSETQRKKLETAQQGSFRSLRTMTLIILFSLLIGIVPGGIALIAGGSIALLLSVLALMEYLTSYRAFQHDLALPEIETAQGVLDYVMRENAVLDGMTHPAGIRIGDLKFLLMEDQVRSFLEGEVYVLYYAPATHRLLSVERAFLQEDIVDEGEIVYWDNNHLTQNSGDI